MPDPQLAALAKHCRREAAADQTELDRLQIIDPDYPEIRDLTRRLALWLQLADEIDAYLAGQLADAPAPDDHPALLPETGDA